LCKSKIIAIILLFLFASFATIALVPASVNLKDQTTNRSLSSTKDKIGSRLREEINKQLQNNPLEKIRTIITLQEDADLQKVSDLLISVGSEITAEYHIINGIAASIPAVKIFKVAENSDVEGIYLDELKYAIPTLTDHPEEVDLETATTEIEASEPIYAMFPFHINADKVWEEGIDGTGVVVAVLDTGADLTQNDIKDVIIAYESFTSETFGDGHGHGTAVSGIIAGQAVNLYYKKFKVKGVAPGAKLIIGKVLTDAGYGWDSWIIKGLEWATYGTNTIRGDEDFEADVISMSFGGLEIPNDGGDPMSMAIDRIVSEGVICVAAAANEGMGKSTITSPGVSREVITVGASTENWFMAHVYKYWPFYDPITGELFTTYYENDQMIWWSSRGPTADGRIDPDISAIGAWGITSGLGNKLTLFGGTSMATPIVSGTAALAIQAFREEYGTDPTPATVKSLLMSTSKDLGYVAHAQGAGRVDAYETYRAIKGLRFSLDPPSWSVGRLRPTDSAVQKFNIYNAPKTYSVSPVTFNEVDTLEFSGSVEAWGHWWQEFTVPNGVNYLRIELVFPPEIIYGAPVQEFTWPGATFTDDHIDMILYRVEEDGTLRMINYAYAHSNEDELEARVTPGTYKFRAWGVLYVNPEVSFDMKITLYETIKWDWVTVKQFRKSFKATLKVPADTTPGVYTGFIKVSGDELITAIPVAVNVVADIGQTFEGFIDVPQGTVFGPITGDWLYYTFYVPSGTDMVTVLLSWTDSDTDIDIYLIDPQLDVKAKSETDYWGLFGPWDTTTGETKEVLTLVSPSEGYWLIGLHDIFKGAIFKSPFIIEITEGTPIEVSPSSISMEILANQTESTKLTVVNTIDKMMSLQLAAIMDETETLTSTAEGSLTSINLGGSGWTYVTIDVMPGTITLELSLDWPGDADLDLVLYDPGLSACRGYADEKDEVISISDPVIGTWYAIIIIGSPDYSDVPFTLTINEIKYKEWTWVTLSPESFEVSPGKKKIVTVTASYSTPGIYTGRILIYDVETGNVYIEVPTTIKILSLKSK
jgi:subtilisin family serine protease